MSAPETMTVYRETPARFTAAEFVELLQHPPVSEWLGKIELVEGIIVRMAPANVPHWVAQRLVFLRLQSVYAAMGPQWMVGQEPTVRLAADTLREPDVAVLLDPDLNAKLFDRTALFLAVEIADTSLALDLGEKRRNYADAQVPHYWVVDLNKRNVRVFSTPMDGDYRTAAVVPFGSPLSVPGTEQTIVVD